MDAGAAHHGARSELADRAVGPVAAVWAQSRRSVALAEQDQPVEVEATFNLEGDVAFALLIAERGGRLGTQATLRVCRAQGRTGGEHRQERGTEEGAAHWGCL